MDLDSVWKLFYFGADPSMSAQAVVEILACPRLTECVPVFNKMRCFEFWKIFLNRGATIPN